MPAQQRKETDEDSLLRRIKNGEQELFYDLIRPYERSVYLAAFSVLGNEADAEEVAQEAFLKALGHLDQFRGESKFSTWLLQIAINEARLRRRKERRALYESLDEAVEGEEGDYRPKDFADWREIPVEALERRGLAEALRRALNSLRPIYREVAMLRDVQHLSIAETAAVLGISATNVRTRLLRARLMLRDALAPGYGGAWSLGETKYRRVRPW